MDRIKINKDYTLFVTSDILEEREVLLDTIRSEIEKYGPFNILAPVYYDKDGVIFYNGGGFTLNEHLPYPECQAEEFVNQFPEIREVDFSPLWCFVLSEKVISKMGEIPDFGDDIFVHADFLLRAQKLGFKIKVSPTFKVTYKRAFISKSRQKKFVDQLTESKDSFDKKYSAFLDSKYRLPVVFHSHVGFPGGYNLHARSLIKALVKKKIKVNYKFIGGSNDDEPLANDFLLDDLKNDMGSLRFPQVVLSTGLNCFANSGDYKIGFTTTEVDGIPKDWVKVLNEMDEVWTTSESSKKSFQDSGVLPPIFNIREGVDPEYFHPDIKPFDSDVGKKFLFLSNFSWGRRKGVDTLFEAFSKEFSNKEDVALVIKALPSYQGEDIQKSAKKLYHRDGGAPIVVWDAIMPVYYLGRFYTSGHVFVFPTRGEGFGIPPLEALACGLPVITTGYSAQTEYLKKDGKPLPGVEFIDYKIKPYDGTDSAYYEGFDWAEPDINHLRQLMRKVFDDYKRYKIMAAASSEYVRSEWNWDKSADLVIKRLENYYNKGVK